MVMRMASWQVRLKLWFMPLPIRSSRARIWVKLAVKQPRIRNYPNRISNKKFMCKTKKSRMPRQLRRSHLSIHGFKSKIIRLWPQIRKAKASLEMDRWCKDIYRSVLAIVQPISSNPLCRSQAARLSLTSPMVVTRTQTVISATTHATGIIKDSMLARLRSRMENLWDRVDNNWKSKKCDWTMTVPWVRTTLRTMETK